ncbi:hypothetical protein [Streptosporangium sp. CA-115845]|uniref:hypothetical protein n=1 Tax=Streptosporangium sp. CA-115845 TaxID=3240071 RepID=UPI003D8AF56B
MKTSAVVVPSQLQAHLSLRGVPAVEFQGQDENQPVLFTRLPGPLAQLDGLVRQRRLLLLRNMGRFRQAGERTTCSYGGHLLCRTIEPATGGAEI